MGLVGAARPVGALLVVVSNPIIRFESPCKTAGAVAWNVNYPSLMARLRFGLLAPSTTEASRWPMLITTMNFC